MGEALLDDDPDVLEARGAYLTSKGRRIPLIDDEESIFDAADLRRTIGARGFRFVGRHWAHALHVPYWWLRCAFDPDDADGPLPQRLWHRLLVWDLMSAPRLTRALERLLNPILGNSVVFYFVREGS